MEWTGDERKDFILRVWGDMERHHQYARHAIDKMGWWMAAMLYTCVFLVPLVVTVPCSIYWAGRIRWHQQQAQEIADSVQDGTAFPWSA